MSNHPMAWDHKYRQLDAGEIIRETDEVLTDSHLGWQKTNPSCVGTRAPSPLYTAHRIYRRLRDEADDLSHDLEEHDCGEDTCVCRD